MKTQLQKQIKIITNELANATLPYQSALIINEAIEAIKALSSTDELAMASSELIDAPDDKIEDLIIPAPVEFDTYVLSVTTPELIPVPVVDLIPDPIQEVKLSSPDKVLLHNLTILLKRAKSEFTKIKGKIDYWINTYGDGTIFIQLSGYKYPKPTTWFDNRNCGNDLNNGIDFFSLSNERLNKLTEKQIEYYAATKVKQFFKSTSKAA